MFKPIGGRLVTASGVALPLSSGAEVNNVIFLSGALPFANGKVVGDDIETQTNAMFDNVETLLAKEGLTLKNVFKVTVFLVNKQDFAGFNAVYAKRFAEPYPARTTVICNLALDGALIEAEMTVCR
jgi:2-iminobutanoate/2-iminopropanoate deaminase